MRLLGTALVLAALALPATGEEQEETFGESIDVRVVNVEAVVTDGDGRFVRGLSPGDFRLLVDGAEVPVEFFSEMVEGEAVSRPAAESGGEAAAPPPAAARPGRSILVFIDESFAIGAHRDRVLRKLVEDLALLGSGDEMAVVAFDGEELSRLSGYTGDFAALREILTAATRRPAWGTRILASRRSEVSTSALIESTTEPSRDGDGGGTDPGVSFTGFREIGGIAEARDEAILGLTESPELRDRYNRVTQAAAAALRVFARGARGRRVLLYLSGGPSSPDLARDANRYGFTIYPVDVQGLVSTAGPSDVENVAPAVGVSLISSPVELTVEAGLEDLARATGGKASLDGNREQALARMVEDTRAYYGLGFTPAWQGDGQSHSIRVEVRPPGLKVRARRSYTDLSSGQEIAGQVAEILMLGGEERSRLLRVELGTPTKAGRRQVRVPATVLIPSESLAMLRQAQGFQIQAVLSVGAVDEAGGASELPQAVLSLVLPQPMPPGGFARFKTTLLLRRTEQRLVFAVRDLVAERVLWGEVNFKP